MNISLVNSDSGVVPVTPLPLRPPPTRMSPTRFSVCFSALVLLSCGSPPRPVDAPSPPRVEVLDPVSKADRGPEQLKVSLEADVPTVSWAERTLRELTLRKKAGQLIMPWVLGDFMPQGASGDERILGYVEELGIGGVIMSVGSPTEVAAKLNHLQDRSDLPLLVASDLETGAGFRLRGAVQMPGAIELGGATDFPSLMAVGAAGHEGLAYEMGRITAVEARGVGIHVPFAPVLDVNNNPDNPIINIRSFGDDPEQVARLGSALVRGIQEHGAIATGKHFPGHGDTDVDSHLALPRVNHDRARLDSVELRPFRAAVAAGMGGVMTAHIAVPSLTDGTPIPSTLSSAVLTGLLREQMGFEGLLFTDAMDMRAISRQHSTEEAAVRAVEAGADVILMPPSPLAAVEGIVAAVESGRIPESRIDESVLRILQAKASLGLDTERKVPIEAVREVVGIPAHVETAAQLAERSITVLRNGRNLLPLLGTRTARVMSVSFRRSSDVLAGRYFNRRVGRVYPRLTTAFVEGDTPASVYATLSRQARDQALVIVSTYVAAVSYLGSVAMPKEMNDFINGLRSADVPHIVVSFGNPYLVSSFPDVQAYMLAWSGSEASQTAAAGALFGDFAIAGRTPTRIPPLFNVGDGLNVPAKGRGSD